MKIAFILMAAMSLVTLVLVFRFRAPMLLVPSMFGFGWILGTFYGWTNK